MSNEIERLMNGFIKKAEAYQIKAGDTIDKISKIHPLALREKLLPQEILDANPGLNPSRLQINQLIIIPTGQMLDEIRARNAAPGLKDQPKLPQIDAAFTGASAKYGIPEDILRGIAATESSGNICAVSSKGASGLMQLMPVVQRITGVADPMDPVSSIWGSARHMAAMVGVAQKLHSYTVKTPAEVVLKTALTMYNLGETAYRQAIREGSTMPKEARDYADKVLANRGARLKYHCNGQEV